MTKLRPYYEDIEAHYDVENSNDFFSLWLDPTMMYTCAYFPEPDMTLEEAQLAKIDLALDKLKLEPGMTLLDIGCGWGAVLERAYTKYDVNVIGLTISKAQHEYTSKKLAQLNGSRKAEVLLQGWEEFEGHADRVIVIGAFEHFRHERHVQFFEKAHRILPEDGSALLHTIVSYARPTLQDMGLWKVDRDLIRYTHLIRKYIFPGAELSDPQSIVSDGTRAGFRCDLVQPLGLHYAKTLDMWLTNFTAKKDEITALVSEDMYDRYVQYLEWSGHYFQRGTINVVQFTLTKQPSEWLRLPEKPKVSKPWASDPGDPVRLRSQRYSTR